MSPATTPKTDDSAPQQPPPTTLRWRSWPLAQHPRWSWMVPVGIIGLGWLADYAAGPIGGVAAAIGLAITLWQFLLPVRYEISPAGCTRQALGRARLVPWSVVRSYQPRATGIVLFRRAEPAAIDALQSWFVPYAADEDEMLGTVRQYLRHAVELPA